MVKCTCEACEDGAEQCGCRGHWNRAWICTACEDVVDDLSLALNQLSAVVMLVTLLECALHGNAQCSREVAVEMLQGQSFDASDVFERLFQGWPVITVPE